MATRRALLVGINAYPNLKEGQVARPLKGCLADVEKMRSLLVAKGFTDLRTLSDDSELKPTRSNILAAMEALRQSVAGAADQDETPDVVVFFFAGHGSSLRSQEVPIGQRLGHTFQTLVPADSGRVAFRPGLPSFPNRDIFDFELDAWVRRLNELSPAPSVTLVFDCCHAAGVSSDRRGGGRDPSRDDEVKSVAPDERPLQELGVEPEILEVLQRRLQAIDDGGALSGSPSPAEPSSSQTPSPPLRGAAGWLRGSHQRAVVLAACRNDELATGNSHGGYFTLALTKAIERYPTAQRWSQIFDPKPSQETRALIDSGDASPGFSTVHDKVQGLNANQHPVRYGDGPLLAPGDIDFADSFPPPTQVLLRKYAAVIGIGAYGGSWHDLNTPKHDAEAVARVLRDQQGYTLIEPQPGQLALCDEQATFLGIFRLLNRLRNAVRHRPDSAAVLYFAGHGASQPDAEQRRVKGYLVPHGGRLGEPRTWLPMTLLRDFLAGRRRRAGRRRPARRLESRHLLMILDCCFAGTMHFTLLRRGPALSRPIFASELRRFVTGQAWQVLTSSAYNQSALDASRDPRDPLTGRSQHSPFAQALLDGLSTGEADARDAQGRRDRIITVSELYSFLDLRLKPFDLQNPGLAPLSLSNTGQFIFQVPGWAPVADPDPPLLAANNPWPGHRAYGPPTGSVGPAKAVGPTASPQGPAFAMQHPEPPFHGRNQEILQLLAMMLDTPPGPLALLGATGSGKTSLVLGGLLPILSDPLGHRLRVRQWIAELPKSHLLIAPSSLAQVRQWMKALQLPDHFDEPTQLRRRIEAWAQRQAIPILGTSTAEDAIVLPPTVSDLIPDTSASPFRWLRDTRLFELLDNPDDLAFHLRFWHNGSPSGEPTLVDYLLHEPEASGDGTAPPVALRPWRVTVLTAEELPSEDDTHSVTLSPDTERQCHLLVVDSCGAILETAATRRPFLAALRRRARLQPVLLVVDNDLLRHPEGAGGEGIGPGTLATAASRGEADGSLAEDLDNTFPGILRGLWLRPRVVDSPATDHGKPCVLHLPPPSRQDLREAIEQPLLDHALLMPSRLVDRLVTSFVDLPAPLALLGPYLHAMFEEAVARGDADNRRLRELERPAEQEKPSSEKAARGKAIRAAVAPLRRRLQKLYDAAEAEERRGRPSRLAESPAVTPDERLYVYRCLRRFCLDPDRSLDHREICTVDGDPELERVWRRRFLDCRLAISDHRGLRLGHPDLARGWAAFESWRVGAMEAPLESTWRDLARVALSWHHRGQPQGLLWDDHEALYRLHGLTAEHNILERSFLNASLDWRHCQMALDLAMEAQRAPRNQWHRSLLLAAEAVDLARADTKRRALDRCTETLRRLLAATPLSLPLDLPGPALGLTFEGRQLRARTSQDMAQTAPRRLDEGDALAWEIDLEDLRMHLRWVLAAPRVETSEADLDTADRKVSEASDLRGDRSVRILPFTPHLLLESRHWIGPNLTLLGLRATPDYLSWSPDGRWMAAVAPLAGDDEPTYQQQLGATQRRAEVRLWRLLPTDEVPLPGQVDASGGDRRIDGPLGLDTLPSTFDIGSDDSPQLGSAMIAGEPRHAALRGASQTPDGLTFAAADRWLMVFARGQPPIFFDPRRIIPVQVEPFEVLDGSTVASYEHWGARSWEPPTDLAERDDDRAAATRFGGGCKGWLWASARQTTRDATIFTLWDLHQPAAPRRVATGSGHRALTVSRSGRYLITSQRQDAYLWDTTNDRQPSKLPRGRCFEFSPDETYLAVLGNGALRTLALHPELRPLAKQAWLHPSEDQTLRFDAAGRWLLLSKAGSPMATSSAEVAPTGTASTEAAPKTWLWPLGRGGELADEPRSLTGCHAAFSPDGALLALADDHHVICQAPDAWMLHRAMPAPDVEPRRSHALAGPVSALVFHPRGDRLAVGHRDGSVDLLRSRDLRRVERLRHSDDNSQAQEVRSLAFSADGNCLAVGLIGPRQSAVRASSAQASPSLEARTYSAAPAPSLLVLYRLDAEDLTTLARGTVGHPLSEDEWGRYLSPEPLRKPDLAACHRRLFDVLSDRLTDNPEKETP